MKAAGDRNTKVDTAYTVPYTDTSTDCRLKAGVLLPFPLDKIRLSWGEGGHFPSRFLSRLQSGRVYEAGKIRGECLRERSFAVEALSDREGREAASSAQRSLSPSLYQKVRA
jgi:hypothetical protein